MTDTSTSVEAHNPAYNPSPNYHTAMLFEHGRVLLLYDSISKILMKKTRNIDTTQSDEENKVGKIGKLIASCTAFYHYCAAGVWLDTSNSLKTRIIKTLNLTTGAFFNSSLQNKSMALTYSTVLSIVPAFALLVAIGRGFGLQDTIQSQIYQFFPSQGEAISTSLSFVDSYLQTSKQGMFVGVGIVVLLWTIISLLSQIEDSFNAIWGVKRSRTLYQKITDYIAICMMIPVLLICSSGVSIFMSDVIQNNLNLPMLTPVVNIMLSFAPLVLCWLAFTLSYYLIPNTKVKFKYAAISGAMAAVGFEILQLLFVNGQLYVSKYNAIYGSFAFLPLLLVWLQLSWLVLLTGCMIAYSMQNVFTFNLMGDASKISNRGWHNVALIVMAVACKRFDANATPLTEAEIAVRYKLPISIVGRILVKLKEGNMINYVSLGEDVLGIAPAIEVNKFTLKDFVERFDAVGYTDFIPDFCEVYADMVKVISPLREKADAAFATLLVKDLPLPYSATD